MKKQARRETVEQFLRQRMPNDARHLEAMELMLPYLEEMQKAADEQTRADFGIIPKGPEVPEKEKVRRKKR